MPIVQEINDKAKRSHYVQRLARLLKLAETPLLQQMESQRSTLRGTLRVEGNRVAATTSAPESKLEDYCLTLALKSPEQLARVAFLEDEDFADAENRALFGLLKDFVRQSTLIDLGAFRELIAESLLPTFERLAERVSSLTELTDMDLTREIETTAYRLRQNRDRNDLTQVEMLLRDQDSATDGEDAERKMLHERAEFLRRRVAENQKALGARTMFKTRPPTLSRTL
jgi:hypothetical protein